MSENSSNSFPKTGNEGLDSSIEQWLKWNQNENFKNELLEILEQKDEKLLQRIFSSPLEFGTAGIRGRMGPGCSQMNDLTIIQTTQGLLKYLLEVHKDSTKNRCVVIGYDGRHNSYRFAKLTATAFINSGIKTILFGKPVPTPYIPFTVLQHKCWAGIMITASHNPKDDNGYKVYWNNGCQIISPHDKKIQERILQNLEPWPQAWHYDITDDHELILDPLEEISNLYFDVILKEDRFDPDLYPNTSLKFTYTAMHGVGYPYIKKGFETYGYKNESLVVAEEQRDPDPDFPTVEFPNPEEGKSALELAIKTANANNSTYILANDPDADRLAVAEKDKKSGHWRVFTGNELGALFGWWAYYKYLVKNPSPECMSNVYMLSSTVSSNILRTMAKENGFCHEDTLTGFKWLGNKALDLEKNHKKVLFAFEEAIGFMFGTTVPDKDGVSAAIKAAELACFLEKTGKTYSDKLDEIWNTYGFHITCNSYFICHDSQIIKKIFDRLRTMNEAPNSYPDSILSGRYKINGVRDLTTGYDSTREDKKAILPTSKSSQMITFYFENGLIATLRTSGTEPKIKYYTELCAPSSEKNVEEVKKTLSEMVDAIVKEFLQPDVHGLQPRK
ncbi:unnamed protein product [Bemisia tabaci]|uniref:Phosphoglucomutase-2 n=1 Tax=Bemisia tabaci TaxID=7038 RepID=A0A9P0F0W6_BEMTA|nr:unnamed protein product [Bemisia tabaci]